ncbi:MAG TPA: Gfo/Idh/MocA family oxidoreductase [Bryobacteraceae bacterium]|nr:Gfo/Idh/MocA family oxidoreductase [Bryobacteraceae bacterium]
MPDRRTFLTTAATAGFTTNLFTGQVRGANDKIQAAFIGMGKMGRGNLGHAMKQENLVPVAVCDVYPRNLDWAVEMANKNPHGAKVRAIRDFREIIADKSIDVVNISTPDHWHAYMTVEACKAGKDVYVEKPICVTVEEGQLMVKAARKYNRVVQAGTMQRSQLHYQQLAKMIHDGFIGDVTFVRTGNYGYTPSKGIGNPPDSAPPAGLDWDLWLGPAPKRPFNASRFGVDPADRYFSNFRWFWDYAGGMMTDWGIHLLDIVQMAYDEVMPAVITAVGQKRYLTDNRETPDTLEAVYEYPKFIATYENRNANDASPFLYGNTAFHGSKATLYCDRSGYKVIPIKGSDVLEMEVKSAGAGNDAHWKNFIDCVKSRQKPISDIETCFRSSATCLLANVALRSKLRLDWDPVTQTVAQPEARKFLSYEPRAPWKIVV